MAPSTSIFLKPAYIILTSNIITEGTKAETAYGDHSIIRIAFTSWYPGLNLHPQYKNFEIFMA
jgi:hypothetical protein